MRVGITGSRHDRPQHVIERLRARLLAIGATEVHHGDCIGFDRQSHEVAVSIGLDIVIHPPSNPSLRAHCAGGVVLPARDYLARNRKIVDSVDYIIAAPDGPERQRSGTWSTIRYAKSKGVKGVVLT